MYFDTRISSLAALFLFFTYFITLVGPAGGGRTIGMLAMRLRVTDLEGGVPTLQQAAARTLMLFPFTVASYLVVPWASPPASGPLAAWAASSMTMSLGIALIFATSITCAFNPFKQGLHDFWAGTLVRRNDEMTLGFVALGNQLGASWQRHYRQPQFSGRVSFGLIWTALIVLSYPTPPSREVKAFFDGLKSIESNAVFEGARATIFNWQAVPMNAPAAEQAPVLPPTAEARLTSPTKTAATPAAPSAGPILNLQLSKAGLWGVAGNDAALKVAVEEFARRYVRLIESNNVAGLKHEGELDVEVTLVSRADLVLFQPVREHATFRFKLPARFVPAPRADGS